jgi:hypothetical protein
LHAIKKPLFIRARQLFYKEIVFCRLKTTELQVHCQALNSNVHLSVVYQSQASVRQTLSQILYPCEFQLNIASLFDKLICGTGIA